MKMYEVGGCVRDGILGIPSKDIDFSVVMDFEEVGRGNPFMAMVFVLKKMGFEIFLESPEFLTVRAQFPKGERSVMAGDSIRDGYKSVTADFVLARKESDYADGRRPDKVEVGTLMDDLARRDFTMNAIAKDSDGSLIDPYNGVADIYNGIIRAVGDPYERLHEDALRAVRALRFSVTKGFAIERNLRGAIEHRLVLASIRDNISDERIQQELSKMFRHDTVRSIETLGLYPRLTRAMFAGSVSLDSTMKTKGRGK